MNEAYWKHVEERKAQGIPPKPLKAEQVKEVCTQLCDAGQSDKDTLLDLLIHRVPPGVDPAAGVKAKFLADIARGNVPCPHIDKKKAVELLGTMMGGYNINPLIEFLSVEALAETAAAALKNTLLVFDALEDIYKLAEAGNPYAREVMQSYADAEWFTSRPPLPKELQVTVLRVEGEINTDDLSPATHAVTRPDIPLHALSMGEKRFPDGTAKITEIRQTGKSVAFVGDTVGTGSSRKSATNSMLWWIGDDIPFVPNKRRGGVVIGLQIAPIFFNTLEDSGALPIRCDVSNISNGQEIKICPYDGRIEDSSGQLLAEFSLSPETLVDEYRAGGRVPLIIGKKLTNRAREIMGLGESKVFLKPETIEKPGVGYSLAQKIVGRACGMEGVYPGMMVDPVMTTVGSQDTTGPMTANEIEELACLGFSADLVMQSFCHTAAYPTPTDKEMHEALPKFITERGGVSLKPGDGIIHSWLNRMILPDTVGTGGDSHTRFPLGLSFPAGSGLVAFAAALGVMPLEMPESVLVRFSGELRPGMTLRDVVNAIPYYAIKAGLLTVAKQGKKNIFNGRVLEIEGLPDLKLEQAFELTDASAERSAAGSTIKLGIDTVCEYLRSNATLLKNMIADGYGDAKTLERRIKRMEEWLANPHLLEGDPNAEYAAVLEIDLAELTEPIVACPNDPDDVKTISQVVDDPVQEVFIGSCMTNIGHFRAAAKVLEGYDRLSTRLWICPPTRMDEERLKEEGVYQIFEALGSRMELPGCSLCMGNQARVEPGATVFSTSTRNFDNRMGDGAKVYLGSAELAAVVALLGRIPEPDEYFEITEKKIKPFMTDVYQFMNFDRLETYQRKAASVSIS